LSSLWWCDQVTQSKAPLDSAAIYPITRSPTNTLRPVKGKPSKDITLPWASRLILMMMLHALIKPKCFTWSLLLREDFNLLPHKPLWDRFINTHIHKSIITKCTASFKHMIFLRCLSWTFTTQPWWRTSFDFILPWAIDMSQTYL
jgi:hypothetical protein